MSQDHPSKFGALVEENEHADGWADITSCHGFLLAQKQNAFKYNRNSVTRPTCYGSFVKKNGGAVAGTGLLHCRQLLGSKQFQIDCCGNFSWEAKGRIAVKMGFGFTRNLEKHHLLIA